MLSEICRPHLRDGREILMRLAVVLLPLTIDEFCGLLKCLCSDVVHAATIRSHATRSSARIHARLCSFIY